MSRAAQEFIQESHWTRGMSERHQSSVVDCGDQHARGDADRLLRVIVLDLPPVWEHAVALGEDDDYIRRTLQERFVLVCTQWCQRVQPFLWGLVMVKFVLFFLCFYANPMFDRRIA